MPDGFPRLQPQEAKSLQPGTKSEGSCSQRYEQSAVFWQVLYQLPNTALCCCDWKPVPGFIAQMLAVDHCKLSKPGTATSKCGSSPAQPFVHGGHRFFFITTAVQSELTAPGFWMSKHFPQPPLSVSDPQQPSSAPISPARASDAAPVSHIFSP